MSHIFVANWKMRMHFFDALNYCTKNYQELVSLADKHPFILCPSFVALAPLSELLKNSPIKLGAQDCSPFTEGSHTGEVSAQSLREIGCSYCIVGHSERRAQFNETNESIAEKILRLIENQITPIICIGESELDAINERTYSVLEEQLAPIFITLQSHRKEKRNILFAYEPVWAIGTGIIPEQQYVIDVFNWLHKTISQHLTHDSFQLLYGGSVDKITISDLKKISSIDGFLIGGASTNFLQLQRIIKD
jgi:triosephosphate isomerase